MLVVAGLSLKNLHPRVWDASSPYYLSNMQAVMVSYADFARNQASRRAALRAGLHEFLGIPKEIQVFLDNGAFYFLGRTGETTRAEYEQFVSEAKPDWWPIPQDFIPTPRMTTDEQRSCLDRTMQVNLAYQHDGYVPVIHVSPIMSEYICALEAHGGLRAKARLALGGLVPNLLRAPKARPYIDILEGLISARAAFPDKRLHAFGVGGTATLHLMALLKIDSVDSSGWRNRAARGIVQLPGSGDRMVANLGSWRGREPAPAEWELLAACPCPACSQFGLDGLRGTRLAGFCNRATHNLWVLLQEAAEVEARLANGTYTTWFDEHLDNSIYLPLIRHAVREHLDPNSTGPVSR